MVIYCLACGSNCCVHLQKSHARLLSRRELELLQLLLSSKGFGYKEIGHELKLSKQTVKIYINKICKDKLLWANACSGRLRLWAFAHAEKLGLTVPTVEDFKDDSI